MVYRVKYHQLNVGVNQCHMHCSLLVVNQVLVVRSEIDIEADIEADANYKFDSNRFQMIAHLGQMHSVDTVLCMIDSQLKFTRNNQDLITGTRRNGVDKESKVG